MNLGDGDVIQFGKCWYLIFIINIYFKTRYPIHFIMIQNMLSINNNYNNNNNNNNNNNYYNNNNNNN